MPSHSGTRWLGAGGRRTAGRKHQMCPSRGISLPGESRSRKCLSTHGMNPTSRAPSRAGRGHAPARGRARSNRRTCRIHPGVPDGSIELRPSATYMHARAVPSPDFTAGAENPSARPRAAVDGGASLSVCSSSRILRAFAAVQWNCTYTPSAARRMDPRGGARLLPPAAPPDPRLRGLCRVVPVPCDKPMTPTVNASMVASRGTRSLPRSCRAAAAPRDALAGPAGGARR